ncbi:hypothetical protein GH714_008753 [Hevea brasiliensis]|uniref:Uncharacterized protein n=1 Tax=Hevea brasiliensis TaxID=3981 RepID=A0A6A6M060_HEVBR|nr:hypothetical protein GH714_008753 [Hevea brasiliensis]
MEEKKNIGKRFMGKVAIVTGSTQGIGFAITQRLGCEGAFIVISSCKQKNVDEAVEKLKAQDAAPHMQKGSSVILVSSIGGYNPHASMPKYGVTKTTLLDLTKALATQMAPDTRVNCIAPVFVPTHFADFITKNKAMMKSIEENTLLNRLGTTEDMASATAFWHLMMLLI